MNFVQGFLHMFIVVIVNSPSRWLVGYRLSATGKSQLLTDENQIFVFIASYACNIMSPFLSFSYTRSIRSSTAYAEPVIWHLSLLDT